MCCFSLLDLFYNLGHGRSLLPAATRDIFHSAARPLSISSSIHPSIHILPHSAEQANYPCIVNSYAITFKTRLLTLIVYQSRPSRSPPDHLSPASGASACCSPPAHWRIAFPSAYGSAPAGQSAAVRSAWPGSPARWRSAYPVCILVPSLSGPSGGRSGCRAGPSEDDRGEALTLTLAPSCLPLGYPRTVPAAFDLPLKVDSQPCVCG